MSATRFFHVVHNGYALHVLSKSGRTLCGKPVAAADRYSDTEARDARMGRRSPVTLPDV